MCIYVHVHTCSPYTRIACVCVRAAHAHAHCIARPPVLCVLALVMPLSDKVLQLFECKTFTWLLKMASNVPETLKIAPNGCDEDESSYFDVMMIGRTGFGKSTVGNKLLGIDSENKSLLGVNQMGEDITTVIKQWDIESDKKPFFETGEGRESVTKKCKLLSNEKSKNRVLDTRGFADTENTRKYGVIKGNLQSFRWILQAQRAYDLRFSRVLYFFPNRGPPERSDGTLQEEIKVMHGFFGQQIFDVMVIIVTNNKRDHYQQAGFSEEDIAETKEVFQLAFKEIIEPDTQLIGCPPVIYILFDEDHKMISDAVVGAGVIPDRVFFPRIPKSSQL